MSPTNAVALDLGTATTRACVSGGHEIVELPSVVALDQRTGKPVAVGAEAVRMAQAAVTGVEIVRPVRGGALVHLNGAAALVRHALATATGRRRFVAPYVLAACPHSASQVHRAAAREVVMAAHTRPPVLVDPCLCGFAALRHDPMNQECVVVVDVGAGSTKMVAVHFGAIIASHVVAFGGEDWTENVRKYVRYKYGVRLSATLAESAKLQCGSVEEPGAGSVTFEGVDVYGSMFRATQLAVEGVWSVLLASLLQVVDEVKWFLDSLPPERAHEAVKEGILFVGGASRVAGLARAALEKGRLAAAVASQPELATFAGLRLLLEDGRYLRAPAGHTVSALQGGGQPPDWQSASLFPFARRSNRG